MRIDIRHHEGDDECDCLAAVAGAALALDIDMLELSKAVAPSESSEQLVPALDRLRAAVSAQYRSELLTPIVARIRGAHVPDSHPTPGHRG